MLRDLRKEYRKFVEELCNKYDPVGGYCAPDIRETSKEIEDFWLALFNSNLKEEREEQKKEDDKHFMEFWDEKDQIDETEAEIFMKGYKWGYSDCKKGRKPIPHDTRNGYCCACDYDIAGFEAKLKLATNTLEVKEKGKE
jgi:hypothetical protein